MSRKQSSPAVGKAAQSVFGRQKENMASKVTNVTASQQTALKGIVRNSSYVIPGLYDLSTEDTNWVLTSSFIIFTMQTGKID